MYLCLYFNYFDKSLYIESVWDLYFGIFTAFYRLRYTEPQDLMQFYRFRHCRVIHYFIFRTTKLHNSCSVRQNVLRLFRSNSIRPYLLNTLYVRLPCFIYLPGCLCLSVYLSICLSLYIYLPKR